MEIIWENYSFNRKKISFTIQSNEFNGIMLKNTKNILEVLSLKNRYTGTIIINNNKKSPI